jgi:hypothetical protein
MIERFINWLLNLLGMGKKDPALGSGDDQGQQHQQHHQQQQQQQWNQQQSAPAGGGFGGGGGGGGGGANAGFVDDWGPLSKEQAEERAYQDFTYEEAYHEPAKKAQLVRQWGYRDEQHFERVKWTFLKYYGQGDADDEYSSWTWGDQWTQAMLNARMRQQQEKMQATAAADPELLAPVEGVTVEQYAAISASQAKGLTQQQFFEVLAQHNLDAGKWDRVSKGWLAKMSRDTTATIATIYGKAFSGAGQGQFGAGAQAGSAAMAGMGGAVGQAPQGGEPISLERYCEINGAMAAWSKMGLDVNAMLKKQFNMTALDLSNLGSYWSQKMMSDFTIAQKMMDIQNKYEAQYAASQPKTDTDISF